MNSQQQQASSGGIGFFGLLGIVFIVLKLLGVIDWAWIWVLAPLWMPLAIALVICVIAIIGMIVFMIFTK